MCSRQLQTQNTTSFSATCIFSLYLKIITEIRQGRVRSQDGDAEVPAEERDQEFATEHVMLFQLAYDQARHASGIGTNLNF